MEKNLVNLVLIILGLNKLTVNLNTLHDTHTWSAFLGESHLLLLHRAEVKAT